VVKTVLLEKYNEFSWLLRVAKKRCNYQSGFRQLAETIANWKIKYAVNFCPTCVSNLPNFNLSYDTVLLHALCLAVEENSLDVSMIGGQEVWAT
jgi:hypothetical protein